MSHKQAGDPLDPRVVIISGGYNHRGTVGTVEGLSVIMGRVTFTARERAA